MAFKLDASILVTEPITPIEKLGEGSFAEVWKAEWQSKHVAIKKLLILGMTPENLRKLELEIKIATTLRHPNLITVYGVHEASPTEIWIVMELADGGSLYDQLSDHDQDIPWSKRWRWAREVVAAVLFLHQQDILHRDIKSPNFLVVKDELKLTDFGMSTYASVASSIRTSTMAGAPGIGTVRWLAPECFAKKPVINQKSDIYAMGIVLWELASRQIPFADQPNNYIIPGLVAYQRERPEESDDCPKELAEIFTKCWEHAPDDRPNAEEAFAMIAGGYELGAGIVTNFAGYKRGSKDGKGLLAELDAIYSTCFDEQEDCLYVNDGLRLRKITSQGEVTTFGEIGVMFGITIDPTSGILYGASSQNKILAITKTGATTILAGSGEESYAEGTGTAAAFQNPEGITIDPSTQLLYVADRFNHRIRKVTLSGEVSTLAGSDERGFEDGEGSKAKFKDIIGLCFDWVDRSLLVCDAENGAIRRISLSGMVTTLFKVEKPTRIAFTSAKNIIVSSSEQRKVYIARPEGEGYKVSVLAGNGEKKMVNGIGEMASFEYPGSIAVNEKARCCYVAEYFKIRKISL